MSDAPYCHDWGKPIYRPFCWIVGHRWLKRGDYKICLRCDDILAAREKDGNAD